MMMEENIVREALSSSHTARTRGDKQGEIQILEAALLQVPNNLILLERLGRAYHESGQRANAKNCYARGLSINPYYVEIVEQMGVIESEEKNWQQAYNLLRYAYENQNVNNPESALYAANYALACHNIGRTSDAKRLLNEARNKGYIYSDWLSSVIGVNSSKSFWSNGTKVWLWLVFVGNILAFGVDAQYIELVYEFPIMVIMSFMSDIFLAGGAAILLFEKKKKVGVYIGAVGFVIRFILAAIYNHSQAGGAAIFIVISYFALKDKWKEMV